jgi:hypothetical protein
VQQRLMTQVDAVVGADRDGAAAPVPVQILKAADELHGPLKPLMLKD